MSSNDDHSNYTHLLESGKYSDLTLVCTSKDFRVHKAVVCTKSTVIAAACDGGFEESSTSIIQIHDFEIDTVQRMLTFMYTGHYGRSCEDAQKNIATDLRSLELKELDHTSLDEVSGHTSSNSETEEADEVISPASMDILIPHIKMNAIAEFYDVPELRLRANTHIEELLDEYWASHGFLETVHEALNSTADETLHNLLATSMAKHIDEILEHNETSHIDNLPSDFVVSVLREVADTKKEVEDRLLNQIQSLENQLHTTKQDARNHKSHKEVMEISLVELTGGIRAFEVLLSQTGECRHCKADFHCNMEAVSYGASKFILRCARCRCRHS